ncbi:MAG TPA: GNAT family N-acetyltransferase [Lacunisphaera sp.]
MNPPPDVLRKKFGRHDCTVRPLQAGDEPRLQEFFHSHTPDTIYERYGCLVSTMTPERASALVNVDQARDCALGIFAPAPPGETLVAVGRYCLDRSGDAAELAFVVREDRRGLGMGTALLRRLIQTARDRGLARLWAQTNNHNADMLGIFRRAGFTLVPEPDNGIICATLVLAPAPAAAGKKPRAAVRRA